MDYSTGIECQCDAAGTCVRCGKALRNCSGRRKCRGLGRQARQMPRVGTAMAWLLGLFGIQQHSGTCACRQRMHVMDTAGPRWCWNSRTTIVGWLQYEAKQRGLPCPAPVAVCLIVAAILLARAAHILEAWRDIPATNT